MTATHTGLCAACGRRFTCDPVRALLLAKHGYRRPYGEHEEVGRCEGAYRQPHERSPDVARECREQVDAYLAQTREVLARLERGECTSLHVERWSIEKARNELVRITPENGAEFRRALARRVAETKANIASAELELHRLEGLLADWKPQPLEPIVAKPVPMRRCHRCKRERLATDLTFLPGRMSRVYVCTERCAPPTRVSP